MFFIQQYLIGQLLCTKNNFKCQGNSAEQDRKKKKKKEKRKKPAFLWRIQIIKSKQKIQ